jgi:hypothetical protein
MSCGHKAMFRRHVTASFLFASGFLLLAPLSLPAAEFSDDVAPAEIAGVWKGAYFYYPELVAVSITVRSLPMDQIEGECELSPAIEPQFHNSGTRGAYHFKGSYPPAIGEFSFAPNKATDPHMNTMKPMKWSSRSRLPKTRGSSR